MTIGVTAELIDMARQQEREALADELATARSQLATLTEERDSAIARAWPATLDDELRWILGRPNFWCASLAHLFQKSGQDIKTKAEDEQAAVIHWMVGLWFEHGKDWKTVADAKIKEMAAALTAGRNGT